MPRRERDRTIADNNAQAEDPQAREPARPSGYKRANDMQSEMHRPERGKMPAADQRAYRERKDSTTRENASRSNQRARRGLKEQAEAVGMELTHKLREQAGWSDAMPVDAGTRIADSMERTAGYLREHDTVDMFDDIERYVKEHPMQALVSAVGIGFLIGRILV